MAGLEEIRMTIMVIPTEYARKASAVIVIIEDELPWNEP